MERRRSQDRTAGPPAVVAGRAAAEVAEAAADPSKVSVDPHSAAFFDVDNTVVRGASIFHVARGLASRRLVTAADLRSFAWQQVKFRLGGQEDLGDMATAMDAALAFVAGHEVAALTELGEEVVEERIASRLYAGTIALASAHLQAGRRVWLVSAAPVELATILAQRLGLTGALGTVSEVVDGRYTGRLAGQPLHGPAKAEAVRALAEGEGLQLERCYAYSDSANDVPMLSLVGHPVAVNADRRLRRHARAMGWDVHDYRTGRRAAAVGVPTALAIGAAAGVVGGLLAEQRRRAAR